MDPIRLGMRTDPLQAADIHVLVSDDTRPVLRADIYRSFSECLAFQEAIVWSNRVFAGYGESVYVIDPEQRTGTQLLLSGSAGYFATFCAGADYLLVATGESVLRLSQHGTVTWCTDNLGLDGVVIHSVEDGIIRGEGEWDPPGGWRPFALRLDTGHPALL